MKIWLISGVSAVVAFSVVVVAVNALVIKYNGKNVPAPAIPREAQVLGAGPGLTYVVMGDSTSIGQGAEYEESPARASAKFLSETNQVTLVNVGVSGARAADVLNEQADKALRYDPDIVLLAVGANDATHFTDLAAFKNSMSRIIERLRQNNPDMKIVVTGCPDMGSVARFPWPAKQVAGKRTRDLNVIFEDLVAKNNLTFARIAERTGPAFRKNPELYAQDKFHPNARGYALWSEVIISSLRSLN